MSGMTTRKRVRECPEEKNSFSEQKGNEVEDAYQDEPDVDTKANVSTDTGGGNVVDSLEEGSAVAADTGKDSSEAASMDLDEQVDKYISENVLVSSECKSCEGARSGAMKMLDDFASSKMMVQVLWSNLTNNFTYKFIPRLLSKPYSLESTCPKFTKIVTSLISRNVEEENKRLGWSMEKSGDSEDPSRSYMLPCQHPWIYSTNIETLAPVGLEETGIALVDELGRILHSRELISCRRFLDQSQFQVGNLYKHELDSLVWGVNGTIYHAGDEIETELVSKKTAYFNIKYQQPELYLPLANTPLTIVREPEDLRSMISDILSSMESHYERNKVSRESSPFLLAIDVEHHSIQSYKGFVSLIQLSTRDHDYIVDPFNVFNEIQSLNEITANPKILKVLHGSDYDVIWLQRDFSVYIVNMFDTGQAARILNTPGGFSLKNLLSTYCSLEVDKSFQLADWRERPLTSQLIEYARGDTHYLLYVYDIMRNLLLLLVHKRAESSVLVSDAFLEVSDGSIVLSGEDLLERFNFGDSLYCDGETKLVKISDLSPSALLTVMHNSRQISLKEYFEKPLDVWSLCFKVRNKLPKSCFKTPKDNATVTLLSFYLLIWREYFARTLDVSVNHLLKESSIIKICQKQPVSKSQVASLYQNTPSDISRSSEYIVNIVSSVADFLASKSEDQVFDFNSQISHIYLNIANSETVLCDPNKYKIKRNHRVIASSSDKDGESRDESSPTRDDLTPEKQELGKGSSFLGGQDTDAAELADEKESPSHQVVKQQTPERSYPRRRSVSIKKPPQDSGDRFADNLFGSSFKDDHLASLDDANNQTQERNKRRISNEIIQDINNTLNGQVPDAFKHRKPEPSNKTSISQAGSPPTLQANTDSPLPEKAKITFEDYYSAKTNDDALDNETFSPPLSVKDQFNDSDDYLHVKRRQKKAKTDSQHAELPSNHTASSDAHPTEKQQVNNLNLSQAVKENADILPASIVACIADLPDFIKNNQTVGSSPNKPKKFVESMKTKKWHKKR